MKLFLFLFLLSYTLNAHDDANKVVYDLSTGNINIFEKKVLSGISFHKSYYQSKLEDLEVAVVIHGDAYKFFIKDLSKSQYENDKTLKEKHKNFLKRIEILSSIYDVEFLICASGIKRLKIEKANIYDFVKITTTSTIALIDKQTDNYQYIPIF